MHAALRLTTAAALLALAGCGRFADSDQIAQATGDVMASLDEATAEGQVAMQAPYQRGHEAQSRGLLGAALDAVLPPAYAATCTLQGSFSPCANGVRTRDFAGCTWGQLAFNGTVTLAFSDQAACTLDEVGESVSRNADFKISHSNGYALKIESTGGGQVLTRTGPAAYAYKVLGMHRVLTDADGKKRFDISTRTLEDIGVTGSSRADRVVNGGKLEISHNLAGYTTELVPENLAFAANCNCPVSGRLVGNTSGGVGRRAVDKDWIIQVNSCGKATLTVEDEVKQLTFDRCFRQGGVAQ